MTTDATGTAQAAPQTPVTAFDKMLALLDAGDTEHGQVEATAEGDPETDEPEAESATEESEAAGDEQAEQDPEDAESEEQGEDEAPAAESLYTVRVDGKEEQVPLSELLAGYSRTSDYTRKTQEVANQRKELERTGEKLVQERQEYLALLPKLRQMLEQEGGSEPNWEALRQTDPVRALLEKQRWDEKQARISTLRQEEERVSKEEEERIQALHQAYLTQQRDALLKRPETAHWADAEKRKADGALIAKTLLEAGFSEQELQITDHRAMLIAYKAAQFDKLQQRAANAKQSVQGKIARSPTVKAGGPAGKPKGAAERARSRLAQTGSKADAEAWFLQVLK
jgi:hypothetical protein